MNKPGSVRRLSWERIRGSEEAFRKQTCVSINLPEAFFLSLIKCLPVPWTMFQYHIGMTYYYPHMKSKKETTKMCFMLFTLCFFQLQLLFLAVCSPWLQHCKTKKKAFFSLSKTFNYLFMSNQMLQLCLIFWVFFIQENKMKLHRKKHKQIKKKQQSRMNQPLE